MTFNWPILLFGVTMLGLVAGYVITRMALFIPLIALVLYLGVEFNLWSWLVWIFWISVILAILAIPVGFFRPVRSFILTFGGIALAVAVLAVSFGTWSWDELVNNDSKPKESPAESTSTTIPSQEEDARDCPDTWLIVQSDNENNRWFGAGIQSIREADSPEEAREAANEWLSLVRRDPQLLKAAVSYFLDRQVNASALVDGKCASEEADSLTAEIELTIAEATVTPEEAPADGTNSGTDADGNVTSAHQAGITGDRSAVKIVLKDGTIIWIMARCGNPVVKGPAPVPPGPTDNPPTTTTTQPPTTTTTKPPCPKGLVPEGGGCVHPHLSDDCMQNGVGCPPGVENDVVQPVQDNTTSGAKTGPTSGAPSAPSTPPPGPQPQDNTVAPAPNNGGYDNGSSDGTGTPGGSTCDSSGCTGGGSTPPAEGPPPTVDDGTYGGDPGGF